MIDFWSRLFGINKATGNRAVAGAPEEVPTKDVHIIRDSSKRLTALHDLYGKYKTTPHAQKIKTVYEKTQRIHTYLISRGRVYELELFHLQHTDHFLSTFSMILDVHHHHVKAAGSSFVSKTNAVVRKVVSASFRKERKEVKEARKLNSETSQRVYDDTKATKTVVPRLTVPQISINTYSKIVYLREDLPDTITSNEIGFTSTPEEKESFITYVSEQLGIEGISYVGNALVFIPNPHNSTPPAEMVPVIHWNGSPYVLYLETYCLFPVSMFRKRQ